MLALEVIAETVRSGLEPMEALNIRPLLRRIATAANERHLHVKACVLRRLFDRRGAGKDNGVGHRQPATKLVDLHQDLLKFLRLINRPILLRG